MNLLLRLHHLSQFQVLGPKSTDFEGSKVHRLMLGIYQAAQAKPKIETPWTIRWVALDAITVVDLVVHHVHRYVI